MILPSYPLYLNYCLIESLIFRCSILVTLCEIQITLNKLRCFSIIQFRFFFFLKQYFFFLIVKKLASLVIYRYNIPSAMKDTDY